MLGGLQAGLQCVTALITCVTQIMTGNFCGTAEVAPEFLHIDVIESRNTVKRMDMLAFRADGYLMCQNGWCLKPTYTYGSKKGKYSRGGLGFGHCVPILQRILITPHGGFYYTRLTTGVDRPDELSEEEEAEFDDNHIRKRYRAGSVYMGVDIGLIVTPCLTLMGTYQYAWSRSHFKIQDFIKGKDHTSGQLYSAEIQYRLFHKFGLHAGVEYNQTLGREVQGLRTFSGKAGLTYWF